MTPQEIVDYLDQHIIGQNNAKKTIALALRTRYRRLRLDPILQDEIMPKNILMIGSTGVGKTEIARRLAKMMQLPFIKVEASKYTEVGFVGRDVESMVRDLVMTSLSMVKAEHNENNKEAIEHYVIDTLTQKLLSNSSQFSSNEEEIRENIRNGTLDECIVEIELQARGVEFNDTNMPPEIARVQESFSKMFSIMGKEESKKEVTVAEAKDILRQEAAEKLLNHDQMKREALKRAEDGGIIFLDEIDKIAVSSRSEGRNDPSKEGVQRDLLPIVEGSIVSTKLGSIKTDHILFIAAGAFHLTKPSDLIPELQGRFPLRVELEPLNENALHLILTKPKNSLLEQYKALLATEEMALEFDEAALRAMAHYAQKANEKTEDIGARRLHTVVEKVLEDISFNAQMHKNSTVTVTEAMVNTILLPLVEDEDLARYIL
ncbi:MAG: HslU--HslV peptidase ATPase subunit [Sulfuricurvum sp. GWF2_44_89]|uniref:HslU--HslV peptidase ATPase subunit n=1 Tax=Sulfuricurvum kujiense TaxID=148813 RepID=A0A2D3WED2_9BACT|nr:MULTISPECIES: HslU--HslV peptidase ATPase subunit [Sulfuricurvum]OHD77569.1 MAG: HslU--HslV peptidase ATPase subunit [Sulfuricurvum sp. GWF2_44_89]OHD92529.1 MAG: HslU--HslV peptidase ATPase subunit [Sulfuricurvum sp. RIFOXYD2_FULL_44_160]OHD96520.1 MAG: HslU--HslV peptidase ATPase subunit [Sulfuricurvum sp. RIFOXYD12_FULL_44_77]DAB38788.1 MAG TPA: HslU--HslV peptidase ATPase subunit [Sulfuricurvum kujiense]